MQQRLHATLRTTALALILGLTLNPIYADSFSFIAAAHAKNGGGNGGGSSGGGHGGGGGRGSDGGHSDSSHDSSESSDRHGQEHSGNGRGHSKADRDITSSKKADKLGRLNAVNASDRARERAASNSAVGQVADYQDLLSDPTIDLDSPEAVSNQAALALQALESTANKPLSPAVIDEVNQRLGIAPDNAIAEQMKAQLESGASEPE